MVKWNNVSTVDDVLSAYHNLFDSGDDRVTDFFLMSGPIPITMICVTYAISVISIGPKLMANRKPFNLKHIIAVYNIAQVIFNTWLFAASLQMWCKYYGWGLSCLPVIPDNLTTERVWAARLCHLYFLNKVIDLLDTLFFVLKKKHDKISLLHVFHHTAMPFSTWFGVKFQPGGNLAFFALPNLFVHIFMYTYYSVANLGPKYQKYIWWKRHLTQLQLLQFGIIGAYMAYTSHVCNLNRYLLVWASTLDILFIYLFINFYRKSYSTNKSRITPGKEKELEGKTQ